MINNEFIKLYTDFLGQVFNLKRPLKAIFDCSNGVAGPVLEELLKNNSLIKYELINQIPDGNFPGHGPNPMYDEALNDLRGAIIKNKADLGIIFDGDGDRVFFLDDRGRRVVPDVSGLLMSKNFSGPIILSITIGFLTRQELKKEGKKTVDSRVGHYFIKKMMKEKNIDFGIEHSGHFYFGSKVKDKKLYFDSGILAAIYFINSVSFLNLSLSNWIDQLSQFYRSGETNFEVKDKQAIMTEIEKFYKPSVKIISRLDGLKMEFVNAADSKKIWWFNVRPSNTENLIRLNLESNDKKLFEEKFSEIKKLIQK